MKSLSVSTVAPEEGRLRLHAMEHRLLRQRDALLALTSESLDDCSALPKALPRIVEVASSTLRVRRVSTWRYNEARTAIECVDLFDALIGRHTSGEILAASDFPNYFRALNDSEIVAVDDAVRDPRTSEFSDGYLKPLSIVSMMDVPIHRSGAVVDQGGSDEHQNIDRTVALCRADSRRCGNRVRRSPSVSGDACRRALPARRR